MNYKKTSLSLFFIGTIAVGFYFYNQSNQEDVVILKKTSYEFNDNAPEHTSENPHEEKTVQLEKKPAIITSTFPTSGRDVNAVLNFKKAPPKKTSRKVAFDNDPKQKLTIKNDNIELLLDYVSCQNECPEGEIITSITDLKIISPANANNDEDLQTGHALGYAYRSKSNPSIVGFWNKQIIILSDGTNSRLQKDLGKFNFAEIASPLKNSYVVVYDQDLNNLDKTIDQIKQIDSVKSVSLDLVIQPVRSKNANTN